MEVYFKFKSAKDYDSIPIDWHYTTVSDVKDYVLKKKCSGKRNKIHYDSLTLINADTDEEYLDGQALIPKSTYLIIRRAPRCVCMPIVIDPPATPEEEDNSLVEINLFDQPSTSVFPRESEWVEFWNDLSPSEGIQDAPTSKDDVESKISDRIKSSGLRQFQSPAGRFGPGRGFGRGFGKGGMSDNITPSPGYICHRCKVPGHFIQHCPTNGDRDFDMKRYQPPRGIPNSMLMASPDGSYVLPGGGLAVLKPDESAFEKEMQGIPSTRSVPVLPAELHCPICKAVMKDAVLASKCCLETFCDKCIRDYIMSNSLCTCGAKNVLADDLIPNKTVRDTIVGILESTKGRGTNGGSAFPCFKVPSPKLSEPSKEVLLAPNSGGNTMVEEMTEPIEAHKRKSSVLAHTTNPEGEMAVLKKRKLGNSFRTVNASSHHRSHNMTSNQYYEDQWNTAVATSKNIYEYADNHDVDDRHFKRRPSKYETSRVPVVADNRRSGRGWTEKRVIGASISELSVF